MAEIIPRGWTAPLDYQLEKNGAAFDATGMTIAIDAEDLYRGTGITLTGTVSWLNITTSQVRFMPSADDFAVAKRIKWRFRVTDADSKVAEFPKEQPNEWNVTAP